MTTLPATPTASCRECGSTRVDDVAVDSWAWANLEGATGSDEGHEPAWPHLATTARHCRSCHAEWAPVDV
ncbi:hypothetical protein [Nocardioides sp. SYSU D00038]|uniref:hypothetical protein n=1 Tax=Nocardioides sp. SYSU D00038 TaxID=2812554 RepID=UPI001967E88A|nr:hypothetical protein [Nocardioides sp. SYSU D00038]